ncbi:hypothetical protein [Zooshikella ganghwensis]|uniref:hypothetical protein n=1 Tax=Zooshikella ganghwensis TaxID=202772 RepID=UPI0004290DA3|nr:hypothetical protein [Zooshikella ganghwensis]
MLILTFRRTDKAYINDKTIITFAEKSGQNNARIIINGPQFYYDRILGINDKIHLKPFSLMIYLLAWNSRYQLRMGFEAPENVIILREKVYLKERQKRLAA